MTAPDNTLAALAQAYGVATDFWDYGRDWLEKGDKSDFKALRTF